MYRVMLMLLVLLAMNISTTAQNTVQLALGVPAILQDDPELRAIVEAVDDVQVTIVPLDAQPPALTEPTATDDYLNQVAAYVSQADVLLVSSEWVQPAATRAQLLLDLAPVVASDTALQPGSYYPAMYDAFAWEAGRWALPLGATDTTFMLYDETAFADAGLTYTPGSWQLSDVANAAQALATQADDGSTVPGVYIHSPQDFAAFMSSVAPAPYDAAALNRTPAYTTPDVQQALTTIAQLISEGALQIGIPPQDNVDAPLQIGRAAVRASSSRDLVTQPLPNGGIGLEVTGVAINPATADGQAAYTLARTLSQSSAPLPTITVPAQREGTVNPAIQEALTDVSATLGASATPAAGQFYTYLPSVLADADPTTLADRLQMLQTQFSDAWTAIDPAAYPLSVDATYASAAPQDGVTLRFAVASNIDPLPNRAQWEDTLTTFADENASVDNIALVVPEDRASVTGIVDSGADCFYANNNYSNMPDASLLDIAPLLPSDPTLDPADFLPGTLDSIEAADGSIRMLPLVLMPDAIAYHTGLLEEGGLPLPTPDWSIDQLNTIITQYPPTDDAPVLASYEQFNSYSHLEHLFIVRSPILPITFGTEPLQANFTDPQVVETIRTTLAQVQSGGINYYPLFGSGFEYLPAGPSPLASAVIDNGTFRNGNFYYVDGTRTIGDTDGNYRFTLYPTGRNATPFSYTLGGLYINAQTAYPEVCYQLISYLSQQSETYATTVAMPVRYSILQSSALQDSRSPALLDLFQQIETRLQRPDLILIPSDATFATSVVSPLRFWLWMAIDQHLTQGNDLTTSLEAAQRKADSFLPCVYAEGGVPSRETIRTCAADADPEFFGE